MVVATTVPLLCSCALVKLKPQVAELERHGAIGAVLSPPPGRSFPTYALLWTRAANGELESVGFQPVSAIGIASFDLFASRTYGVAVFTGENWSGKCKPGEPLAFAENVSSAQFASRKRVTRPA
jgi:hypothetical protein